MIDWSVFDGDPELTVECRCGAVYRSHAKAIRDAGELCVVCRKACPKCGASTNPRRLSSDPERYVIGPKDVA